MTRLETIVWLNAIQVEILAKHNCTTLEQLASFEVRDSMADVIPIPNLRGWARRARKELGNADPMLRIGAAAGAKYPVYAGGIKANGTN